MKSGREPERGADRRQHRTGSKKLRPLDGGGSAHIKASRKSPTHVASASRGSRHVPPPASEGGVAGSKRASHHGNHHHHSSHHHHHHHHGREQLVVVAKPKHKRSDYRLHRLRAIMEAPQDEAFRRPRQRQRKELHGRSAAVAAQPANPYRYAAAGSDSEYSAECASLFHSTIADTSEDERSNYTANRFGDSESSEDEEAEESTATSDTEESGGGGSRGRGQTAARAVGQEMTPAQAKAFVKIKASHNLKKKILRFRSGSLKLMTTV